MPFTIEPLTRPRALRRLALAGVCVTLMVAGVTPAAHAQVRDRGEHTQCYADLGTCGFYSAAFC